MMKCRAWMCLDDLHCLRRRARTRNVTSNSMATPVPKRLVSLLLDFLFVPTQRAFASVNPYR